MRIVVDTNVIVSALLNPDGSTNPVLSYLAKGKCLFLYSQDSLDEIFDVLSRPRIRRGIVDDFDINEFVELLKFRGEEIIPVASIRVCRDPDDNKFLEIAVDGHADYIVSGDSHLLSLNPFRGIPIIKPAEFLNILDK